MRLIALFFAAMITAFEAICAGLDTAWKDEPRDEPDSKTRRQRA